MIAKQICTNRCTLRFAYVSYTPYGTCKLRNRTIQKNIKQKCCHIWHVPCTHLVLPWSIPLQTCSTSDHLVPCYLPSYRYWYPLSWTMVIKYFLKEMSIFVSTMTSLICESVLGKKFPTPFLMQTWPLLSSLENALDFQQELFKM